MADDFFFEDFFFEDFFFEGASFCSKRIHESHGWGRNIAMLLLYVHALSQLMYSVRLLYLTRLPTLRYLSIYAHTTQVGTLTVFCIVIMALVYFVSFCFYLDFCTFFFKAPSITFPCRFPAPAPLSHYHTTHAPHTRSPASSYTNWKRARSAARHAATKGPQGHPEESAPYGTKYYESL